ncbi:MAG: M1 family peptidase, partial [Ferruginibacter sp.]|nr:M1 family peptidase [Cytophagales bacterium]
VLWHRILRGIQQDFKYRTVTTKDIVSYINAKTETDFTYFFDQYLKYPAIPTLMLELAERGTSLEVRYRWVADVKDFRMPIRVSKSKSQSGFIHPTTTWQTITLPAMAEDDFEVDEAGFYVTVEQQ